jgi:general stress protein 26
LKQKWAKPLRAWFPDGLDTDGICLIDVTVGDAQYWDSGNQVMIHAYGVLKSLVTGEGVKDAGDNEKVSL